MATSTVKVKAFLTLLLCITIPLVNAGWGEISVSHGSLQKFFDRFANDHVGSDTPGMVVSVVKDSKTIFSKGYGKSDSVNSYPMDPNKSLLKVGEITSVLTTIAVLQQIENEKLGLKDDVTKYVPKINGQKLFKGKQSFKEPVTVESILVHATGLEDRILGMYGPVDKIRNLTSFMNNFPRRLHPPMTISSTSNYGYAIAGLVVSQLAEVPFEEYISENILVPLKMESSTLNPFARDDAVLSEFLSHEGNHFAQGHYRKENNFNQITDIFAVPTPSASLVTTAVDIAQVMKMVLNKGSFRSQKLLRPEIANLMQQPQFKPAGGTDGVCYGFTEISFTNGLRGLVRTGDVPGFSSLMFLIPNENIGVFVSFNTNSMGLRNQVMEEFVQTFSRYQNPVKVNTKALYGSSSGSRYAGSYKLTKVGYENTEALLGSFLQFTITSTGRGLRLQLPGVFEYFRYPSTYDLTEIESEVFTIQTSNRHPIARNTIGFRLSGNSQYMLINWYGQQFAAEKVAYYESTQFEISLFLTSACILGLNLAVWTLYVVLRAATKSGDADTKFDGSLRTSIELLGALNSILHLACFGLLWAGIKKYGVWNLLSETKLPPSLQIPLFLPLFAEIFMVGLFTALIRGWGKASKADVIRGCVVLAASVGIHYLEYKWNLHILKA